MLIAFPMIYHGFYTLHPRWLFGSSSINSISAISTKTQVNLHYASYSTREATASVVKVGTPQIFLQSSQGEPPCLFRVYIWDKISFQLKSSVLRCLKIFKKERLDQRFDKNKGAEDMGKYSTKTTSFQIRIQNRILRDFTSSGIIKNRELGTVY